MLKVYIDVVTCVNPPFYKWWLGGLREDMAKFSEAWRDICGEALALNTSNTQEASILRDSSPEISEVRAKTRSCAYF